MRTVISKYITMSVLIIVGFGGYCQADTKSPTADKKEVKKADAKKASTEDLPVIKLKVDNSAPSNPKLKKGKGCENLEEVKGETFDDYPEAETIPCDKVDCKDLKPAKLEDYNYKELPTAKTEGSCEE
jgi:PBP1b-binding outer membrane lipoprotein LpoB